ncbi:hypothetical protein [Rathayibacter sp. VKM Ac-2927]|uniref:hypothetical protein n=1 Tax=Rathayibacter sp. VKM Ac-2927 TaxID=2929478 RepID=UPI001FB56BF9|nr:hypothetical protein [Rathayibacter sp. VKM Ac-2927]MCJ1687863.1 hypothetical protein [Rathayibacter sp. VKM Ac-2927]
MAVYMECPQHGLLRVRNFLGSNARSVSYEDVDASCPVEDCPYMAHVLDLTYDRSSGEEVITATTTAGADQLTNLRNVLQEAERLSNEGAETAVILQTLEKSIAEEAPQLLPAFEATRDRVFALEGKYSGQAPGTLLSLLLDALGVLIALIALFSQLSDESEQRIINEQQETINEQQRLIDEQQELDGVYRKLVDEALEQRIAELEAERRGDGTPP